MIINIRKFGNSNGIILPKSILDEMSISTGAKLELIVASGDLTLKPVKKVRAGWAEACNMLVNHPEYEELLPDIFEDDSINELPY